MADALFNGHGGRKPRHRVHLRSFKDPHVLSDIRGKAFEVTALTFGKEDIESQGRFARTRNACQDHNLVAGDREIQVMEVVFPGTPYIDTA